MRVRIVMDEVVGQGHLVVGSEVEADARVPGLDDAGFTGVVELADAACPFSVLIKASASVTVRARLID